MKGELLILFVILLLGLILCSFLGGKGCLEGMENNSSSQVFYGPNGSSAQIQTNSDGQNSLVVNASDGSSVTYSTDNNSSTTYSGPNGSNAKVVTGTNGNKTLIVQNTDGSVHTYQINNTNDNSNDNSNDVSNNDNSNDVSNNVNSNYDNYNHYNGTSYPTIFYGPNGGTARVIKTPNNNTIVITNKNGTTDIYYIDNNSSTTYYGQNGGSAKVITTNDGKQAVEITGPNGSKIYYTSDDKNAYSSQDSTLNQYSANSNTTGSDYNDAFTTSTYNGGQANLYTGPAGNTYATYDSSAYYNSLPQGIPRSMIPPGQEDLYILKTEVVPPVCPKCPDPIVQCPDNNDVTKCPPCPPCARCPEPAFDCKKVANYKAFNPDYMPVPVLSDFSGFGM
jgi:hypothetical protein